MAVKNLQDKFIHGLGDIYDAEHRFLDAQRDMVKQANAPTLKNMIQEHITQTEQQIRNLDQVFNALGQAPKRVKCDGAEGIVSEGEKTLKECQGNPELVDSAIAGAASKVEHYEISSYRSLIQEANVFGHDQVRSLLQQNLQQEEQTAQRIEQSTPQLLQKVSGSTSGFSSGTGGMSGGTSGSTSGSRSSGRTSSGQ